MGARACHCLDAGESPRTPRTDAIPHPHDHEPEAEPSGDGRGQAKPSEVSKSDQDHMQTIVDLEKEKAKQAEEEAARKAAEEKAAAEAAAAKEAAEAKARKEAEEKAREEQARKEAEAKARKEAEAKAKKDAEEKAKKEAEEKAAAEAAAKKAAEDQAAMDKKFAEERAAAEAAANRAAKENAAEEKAPKETFAEKMEHAVEHALHLDKDKGEAKSETPGLSGLSGKPKAPQAPPAAAPAKVEEPATPSIPKKLRISINSATGLHSLNMSGDQIYCTVEVGGKSWSTAKVKNSLTPIWNATTEMDYKPGGPGVIVQINDAGILVDKIEGMVEVKEDQFASSTFEGEVPISGCEGGKVSLKIEPLFQDDPEAGTIWVVVGGEETGGIRTRDGESLTSAELPRLRTGARIKQLELIGERLNYQKLVGEGPEFGWVSTRIKGKQLVEMEK